MSEPGLVIGLNGAMTNAFATDSPGSKELRSAEIFVSANDFRGIPLVQRGSDNVFQTSQSQSQSWTQSETSLTQAHYQRRRILWFI